MGSPATSPTSTGSFGRSGWKIGKHLFEDPASAERYREKHERRLSAMGLTGATANAFSVNTELSVLTMAGASLGQTRVSKSASTPAVAASS
jgi:Putative mono-oxygenase ydhR